MRILYITHYSDVLGANWSLFHLAREMRDRHSADVMIWMPRPGPFADMLDREGIPYRILPFANWAYTVRSFGFWLFPLRWFSTMKHLPEWTEEARNWAPDLVHSNSSIAVIGALVADQLQVPHVWHFREFAWQHYRFFFLTGKKFVHRYHKKAAAFIAISHALRASELKHVSSPVFTIYDGIGKRETLEKMEKNRTPNLDGRFVFLNIGLFHPSKNQLEALRAFRMAHSQASETKMLIVGRGRRFYTWRLKWYVWRHGLDHAVEFPGFVRDQRLSFGRVDALVMCSRHEAMGRVVLEALAHRLPALGYRSGALPELIREGWSGYIYSSVQELADAMLKLYHNPEQVRLFGENGRNFVLEHFTDERYVDEVQEVYRSVLGEFV